MSEINQRIVLASRPDGRPAVENFRLEEVAIPEPGDGEVLLKLHYLSLDPYMRGRMSASASYAAPVEINSVMEGGTVGEIVKSNSADFVPGDVVLSHSGWQSYAVAKASALRRLDPKQAPLTTALGVLGMTGFTAYAGLLTIGQPKEGETVVVAAATGAVGSVVGQIAKIKGARTVGIAGGPIKCKALIEDFGFDVAVDHRSANFAHELALACTNGIDVYFENVGGKVFEAVFPLLNPFARMPVCGLIAQYNQSGALDGLDRLPTFMRDLLTKSLTVRGFIQRDFADQRPLFYREMARWVADGKVRYREDIVAGLQKAPEAFIALLEGGNFGKLIVKIV